MGLFEARSALVDAGYDIGMLSIPTPPPLPALPQITNPAVMVLQQNPPGGTVLAANSSIDVVVSRPLDLNLFLLPPTPQPVPAPESTGDAYYLAIDPTSSKTTRAAWLQANFFGAAGTNDVSAVYGNNADLGFGRHMHLLQNGNTYAYYVDNYPTADDAAADAGLIATVAMEFGPGPAGADPNSYYTRFYIFNDAGIRVSRVDLDGRGLKALPDVCTVCHGGNPMVPDGGAYPAFGNIGANFIPFDLHLLAYSNAPGLARSDQEPTFQTLNAGVRETLQRTFDYSGPPILIPDNNDAGVSIPITISNLDRVYNYIGVSFPAGGIDHPFLNDLQVQLQAPDGRTVTLLNRPEIPGASAPLGTLQIPGGYYPPLVNLAQDNQGHLYVSGTALTSIDAGTGQPIGAVALSCAPLGGTIAIQQGTNLLYFLCFSGYVNGNPTFSLHEFNTATSSDTQFAISGLPNCFGANTTTAILPTSDGTIYLTDGADDVASFNMLTQSVTILSSKFCGNNLGYFPPSPTGIVLTPTTPAVLLVSQDFAGINGAPGLVAYDPDSGNRVPFPFQLSDPNQLVGTNGGVSDLTFLEQANDGTLFTASFMLGAYVAGTIDELIRIDPGGNVHVASSGCHWGAAVVPVSKTEVFALCANDETRAEVGLFHVTQIGGNGLGNVLFTDAAPVAVDGQTTPLPLQLLPSTPLAELSQANPNGVWNLIVRDLSPGSTGTVNGFSIHFAQRRDVQIHSEGSALIEGWYGGPTLPTAFNQEFVPAAWQPPAAPAAATQLYTGVVAQSCRLCHAQLGSWVDFSSFAQFMSLSDAHKQLVYQQGRMPLSLRTFDRFWFSARTGNQPTTPFSPTYYVVPGGSAASVPFDQVTIDQPALLANFLDNIAQADKQKGPGQPIANAGGAQTASPGETVSLDGSHSLFTTTFFWVQLSGPPVTLAGASTAMPSFVAPDLGTSATSSVVLQLTASNGQSSGVDTATVNIVQTGTAPSYANDVHPIFDALGCSECHIPNTGHVLIVAGMPSQDYAGVYGETLVNNPPASPLLLFPTGGHSSANSGGNSIVVGDTHYNTILAWITAGAPDN